MDLGVLGCVFRSPRRAIGTAAGGAVMGDPAAAVVWLASALAARGEHLAAGSVVLSGGLTASVALEARGSRDRGVRRTRLGRGPQLRGA